MMPIVHNWVLLMHLSLIGHNTERRVLPNIEKRLCFVDLDITYGAVFTGCQVADNAHFTN